MRRHVCGLLGVGFVILTAALASAQPPDRAGREPGREGPPPLRSPLFQALDTDHDGVLSAEEIQAAGESLKKLDKNGDGKLTEDELRPDRAGIPPGGDREVIGDRARPGVDRAPDRGPPEGRPGAARDEARRDRPGADRGAADRGGPDRAGADGRRADRDGPGRDVPGRAGRPGPAGPPSILPPFARESLRLTEEQRQQLDALDADVREKLGKILTPEQKQELDRMRQRGPDGPPPGRDAQDRGVREERAARPDERGPREEGRARPGRPPRDG